MGWHASLGGYLQRWLPFRVLMALAWLAYWYLWGKAFEYGDTYRPVPRALDRALNIAMAACFILSVAIAALGSSRLIVAWNARNKRGSTSPPAHREIR